MFRMPLEVFPFYSGLFHQNAWQMNWFMTGSMLVTALVIGKGAEKLVVSKEPRFTKRRFFVPFWMSDYRNKPNRWAVQQ